MVERSSTKRPWLAVLLGVLATGAGHLYLRRWLRAVGWLALTTAVTVIYVPEAALTAASTGDSVALEPFLPTFAVIALSVADAYIVARLTNRLLASPSSPDPKAAKTDAHVDSTTTDARVTAPADDDDSVDCPHCGKPLDPDLEFCHWCSTDLGNFDAHRSERRRDDA